MGASPRLRNPYIAGRALGQAAGFVGRDDILRLVEAELSSEEQSAVVLFGQRRIGKTSILLQLQRRLDAQHFLPVYFDLMDRARRPLGFVLAEVAGSLAAQAAIEQPDPANFDDEGLYFRTRFLPELYQALGDACRPLLLLDEFDVLDAAAEEQLPPSAAARAFFPYLRELMRLEPHLGFVFVVGRRAEDLSIDVKATFKTARSMRVSVLDPVSARELVLAAARQGSLRFTDAAVERILTLTAGHPYLLQLLCQLLWNDHVARDGSSAPTIDVAEVEEGISQTLEAGQNIFEWIWDGLPPAERVIFAAVASATDECTPISEEQLLDLLQQQGIRILSGELELAPSTLVDWEMLRRVEGGYLCFIELLRSWVARQKPLPKVKDELDRIDPLADTLYVGGNGFYRQRELELAQAQLRQALRMNPNHLKARLLLAQILVEENKLDEAIIELELAYSYDSDAGRYPLARALMAKGEDLERQGQDAEAAAIYERCSAVMPSEPLARERRSMMLIRMGERAEGAGDLDAALGFYGEAGADEQIAAIHALRRQRELGKLSQDLEAHLAAEEWSQAITTLERLRVIDPDNPLWVESLEQARHSRARAAYYEEGRQAFTTADFTTVLRTMAAIVADEALYKEAALFLAVAYANLKPDAPQIAWAADQLAAIAADPLAGVTARQRVAARQAAKYDRPSPIEDHTDQPQGAPLPLYRPARVPGPRPSGLLSHSAKAWDEAGIRKLLFEDKLAAAIQCFDKAIAIDSGYAPAYFNRAEAYRASGNLDKAVSDYDKAIAERPGFVDAFLGRAAIEATTNPDSAIADCLRALAIEPTCKEALELLSRLQKRPDGPEPH